MTFTTDDLKRLKEWCLTKAAPTDWTEQDSKGILSLIARLEAAEKFCRWLEFDDNDISRELIKAWRKSKGE